MNRPGDRLRRIALRWCAPRAVERLIDPLIADLQFECSEAERRGRVWRARWLSLRNEIAFWKVFALSMFVERRFAQSLAAGAGAATIALLCCVACEVLQTGQWWGRPDAFEAGLRMLYLVPDALTIALPVGLCFGAVFGSRRNVLGTHERRNVVAASLACSALVFVVANWLLPQGNQGYRELVAGHPAARGANELTFAELASRLHRVRSEDTELVFWYAARIAVVCAPLALGVFAIAVSGQRRPPWAKVLLGGIGCLGFVVFYVGFPLATWISLSRLIGIVTVAWLPNITMLVASGVLTARSGSAEALGPP